MENSFRYQWRIQNFHKNLFLDMMVESRGLVTGKAATSATSSCLVAGMYGVGDATGLSRSCHGEVGVMEFGL